MGHDAGPGEWTEAVAVDWEQVWTNVAAQLNGYRDVGLEALLTEDVLRFSTLQQLAGSGLDTRQLEVEWAAAGRLGRR